MLVRSRKSLACLAFDDLSTVFCMPNNNNNKYI